MTRCITLDHLSPLDTLLLAGLLTLIDTLIVSGLLGLSGTLVCGGLLFNEGTLNLLDHLSPQVRCVEWVTAGD